MSFIDIFNFKKYIKTSGDATLARVGHVNAVARPYKVYTALLNQTGSNPLTDAPTAIVLENTLGAVITYQYFSNGIYGAILDINLFTSFDEHTSLSGSYDIGGGLTSTFTVVGGPNLVVIGTSLAGIFTDGLLNSSFVNNVFEIRVYN